MQSAKRLARTGIFYLEEAVLEVLFEVMEAQEDPFIKAVDIARKIGVYDGDRTGWLTASILYKLRGERRVQQKKTGGPWKLTEAEYEKRK